ncbi:MAG: hypothetical protein PHW24_03740 [Candidatus Moranbacteria bacterium]|nr:hypothetical protein [Candidatus Moranbacteria bacterium]
MADPITPTINVFQARSDAFQQQVVVDIENAKEEKRITDSVRKNADDIKARTAAVNAEIVELRNENKEKGYDLKKKPAHEIGAGNSNEEELKTELRYTEEANLRTNRRNNAESGVLDMDKAKLQYEQTLKTYAEVEYKHRSTFQGIAKFFGKSFNGKADDNFEVKEERKRMEDDLRVYRDAWIRDIENKGLKDGELKSEVEKMLIYFNYQAAIDLYDARSGAKANSLWPSHKEDKRNGKDTPSNYGDFNAVNTYGKNEKEKKSGKFDVSIKDILYALPGAAWAGVEKIEQQYNKLPMMAKLALSGAIFASGSWALYVGKRFVGGAATAVGASKGLDALHQRSMKKKADSENQEFLNPEGKENEKVDFEKLRVLLDGKIGQIDEKMNKHKIASLFNKFAGAGIGMLLGTGTVSKALGAGFEKVTEYFHHGKQATEAGSGFMGAMFAHADIQTPLADAMEHPDGGPVNFAQDGKMTFQDALQTHASNESLVIKEGSNFSKTLLKEFNNPNSDIYKYHPELKGSDPHELVRRVVMDFRDTHPEMEGHNPDYVLANSEIHFNPAALHAEMDEGQYGFYEESTSYDAGHGHGASVGNVANHGQHVDAANQITTHPLNAGEITQKVVEEVNVQKAAEMQQHIATGQEMFKSANVEYDHAASEASMHPAGGDGPSIEQYEAMGHADKMRDAAVATVENATHAKDLYFKSIKDAANGIYKTTGYKWDDIKDLNYSSAYADEKLNPIIKQTIKEFKKEFGGKNIPNYNTSFGKWLYRVQEITIKKRLGIYSE